MADGVVLKLGGVPLTLSVGQSFHWRFQTGVEAYQTIVTTTTSRAREILERGRQQISGGGGSDLGGTRTRDSGDQPVGPLTLEISPPGYTPLIVRGIYVIRPLPGIDDNTMSLLIADRRWLWKRILVERLYNHRKRTGDRRLVSGELVQIQVAQNAADFGFRRSSLNDGRQWEAIETLEDVLRELVAEDFVLRSLQFQEPVESLQLRDPGDRALQRALAFLQGADVWIDKETKVQLNNTLDQSERQVVESAPPPIRGSGSWALTDFSLSRPPLYSVFFEREPELRFDYVEEGFPGTIVRGREPRILENVMPVPDPFVTIAGVRVERGTWVTIQEYLTADELQTDIPALAAAAFGPLTLLLIRRHYVSGFRHLLNAFGELSEPQGPNVVWIRRLRTIQVHWRQTFRVLPAWGDKIRRLIAERSAILDEETGTRATAQAFLDYTVKPSYRSLARAVDDKKALAHLVVGYQDDLTNAEPSPAEVRILDADQHVFRVELKTDPYGLGAAIAPGRILNAPELGAGVGAAIDHVLLWEDPRVEIDPNFRMAVVMTAVQDEPNNEQRLHRELVTIGDSSMLLPNQPDPGPALGPPWDLVIGAGLETARTAWIDARAAEIEAGFFDGADFPDDLFVNKEIVRALARAQAARVTALFLDRVEGAFSVSWDPSIMPTGNLKKVTFSVSYPSERQMIATTRLELPPVMLPPNIAALLPESVRRVVLRQTQV